MKISASNHILSINYYTPLTSQVKALDINNQTKTKVRFKLPPTHRTTDGKKWRHSEMCRIRDRRRPWENAKQRKKRRAKGCTMSKAQIRQGIMEGTIPSAVSDTGATSTAGTPTDPFNPSDKPSSKVFCLPTGGRAAATGTATLQLDVRAPADEVDIVPNLDQTLLSTS